MGALGVDATKMGWVPLLLVTIKWGGRPHAMYGLVPGVGVAPLVVGTWLRLVPLVVELAPFVVGAWGWVGCHEGFEDIKTINMN